jgi:cysteine desulfurase
MPFNHPIIYGDFNATTPVGAEAAEAMKLAIDVWGNPSSAHRVGRQASEWLDRARNQVARASGAHPLEVVFTSGGSEANGLALLGSFWQQQLEGQRSNIIEPFRLLTSKIEHSSVRDTVNLLKKLGAEVQFVDLVPGSGELLWHSFEKQVSAFKPHLISLMAANNETGVIFPTPQIIQFCESHKILFHTDAVQALGKLSPDGWRGADFVTLTAHKIFGPKGIGALLVKRGRQLVSTHYGGSQEIKRRGGTENMVGILGFGAAAEALELKGESVRGLRDRFETELRRELPDLIIQGLNAPRIPNTSNIRVPGIANEVLLGSLDLDGVFISAGSACSSGSITPSHVLLEIGLSESEAKECLRFSWGKTTTQAEVDTVVGLVLKHVQRIRSRRRQSPGRSASNLT